MSVIKPLHAGWLVALYDYLTGAEGRRCIFKGWEKAGVKEIVNSDKPLPPADPFEEIYQAVSDVYVYTFQSSGHFNFTTEMDSSNSLVLNFAFPCYNVV